MNKKILYLITAAIVLAITLKLALNYLDTSAVSNFDECVAKQGEINPVYPSTCTYKNKVFTQDLAATDTPLTISEVFMKSMNATYTVKGTVKKGSEIGIDYCPDAFYITDNERHLQLRTSSLDSEDYLFSVAEYLNKDVIMTAQYAPENGTCLALMCSCDPSVIVEGIEID